LTQEERVTRLLQTPEMLTPIISSYSRMGLRSSERRNW